jgi:peptide/nickel transport system substrate-binding protein
MKRILLPVAVAAAVLLVVSGCAAGGSTPGSREVDPEGTFRIALASDPGAVTPYKTTLGAARHVFAFGYDTLIAQTAEGKTVPNLAESWEVEPDSVTFTLREGILCYDGSELKASDVAADFDYIKAPETVSPWRSLTVPMEYEVSADDSARTFTITTAQPFGMLLRGAGSLAIVCPAARDTPDDAAHAYLGTGPYQVTEYVEGDHYTLEKRPEYNWGPDGATTEEMPKTVVISFVKNESTAASQLITGEVNAIQLTGPDMDRVEALPDVEKVSSPAIVAELGFNVAEGRVLGDVAVRKALAAALDREQVTAITTDGRGKVATNLIAEVPVLCPADETTGVLPDFDVAAAEELLDEAGWVKGGDGTRSKDGQPLELHAIYKSDTAQPGVTMEYIAEQWKAIGVVTDLTAVTNTAFSETMYGTLDYDVSFSGLNVEMPFMLTPFHGGKTPKEGGRNSASTQNEEFDRLSAEALAAEGDACDLWVEAHKALISTVDAFPLSEGDRPYFVRGGTLDGVGLFTVPTSYRVYKE